MTSFHKLFKMMPLEDDGWGTKLKFTATDHRILSRKRKPPVQRLSWEDPPPRQKRWKGKTEYRWVPGSPGGEPVKQYYDFWARDFYIQTRYLLRETPARELFHHRHFFDTCPDFEAGPLHPRLRKVRKPRTAKPEGVVKAKKPATRKKGRKGKSIQVKAAQGTASQAIATQAVQETESERGIDIAESTPDGVKPGRKRRTKRVSFNV